MSLEAVRVDEVPTGAESTNMKPTTEGERFVAEDSGQGFWSGLVDNASNVFDSLSDAYTAREVARLNGAASTVDTTGSIEDQAGGTQAAPTDSSFIERNKMALMVGGGVLAAVAIVLALKK